MKSQQLSLLAGVIAVALAAMAAPAEQAPDSGPVWGVVANNGDTIPGHAARTFNSYNPPSVNSRGLVVFRGRSTGRPQGPVSGIFVRDMSAHDSEVLRIADRDTEVPQPNNTVYPGDNAPGGSALATYNEFPSIPRIALHSDKVATRGNHPPVWTYVVPEDGSETRAGTTGVYVQLAAAEADPMTLVTGASLLGTVSESPYVDFSDIFRVPGIEPLTRFEVFPGSPSITDGGLIAFKGNYSIPIAGATEAETLGQTGVFWRRVTQDYAGGLEAIELIANSETVVPNPGACTAGTRFGSTAPPSAAGESVVFAGYDDEHDPTCGGIYRARIGNKPGGLQTLVGIGARVPGVRGARFTRFGEGLSYDGRFVGFWGTWGDATKTLRLYCPEEGNRVRRDFCNHAGDFAPDAATGEIRGDPHSVCDDTADPRYPLCYQEKAVPVQQAIFVLDTVTRRLVTIAVAGPEADYDDFLYWNYSGAPPGVGHGEGHAEPPRFRSSAFLAVSGRAGATVRLAFLGRTGSLGEATNAWLDPVDGLYLTETKGLSAQARTTLIETGWDGSLIDPEAVWDDDEDPATPPVGLPVVTLGLEREALRGSWLVMSASMGDDEKGFAGIYVLRLDPPPAARP
jgi:hypothetical protein